MFLPHGIMKNADSYFVSFPWSSDEDASFEPFAHNLPMLLALAHKENITKSSSFYRVRGTKTSNQEHEGKNDRIEGITSHVTRPGTKRQHNQEQVVLEGKKG